MMERITMGKLKKSLAESYDLFLCAASFDERCLTIPKSLTAKMFQKVCIFHSTEECSLSREHHQILMKKYPKAERYSWDPGTPLETLDLLVERMGLGFGRKRIHVLLDATAFEPEVLLMLLHVLRRRQGVGAVTCLYATARDYCPGVEPGQRWLRLGCAELRVPAGYSGQHIPARPERLILLADYAHHQLEPILQMVEADHVALVAVREKGVPQELNRAAGEREAQLLRRGVIQTRMEVYDPSPAQMVLILEELCGGNEDDNVTILPLGGNPALLGAEIFADRTPNVRLCCVTAEVRNESNYSEPGRYCLITQFPVKE